MGPGIFTFQIVRHPARVIGAASFISLVFHGLLLGAIGFALPLKTAKAPVDDGISIDLATVAAPAQPAVPPPAAAEAAPEPPAETTPAPEPEKAEAPKPEPAPMPKKAEAPKPAPKKARKTAPKKVDAPQKAAATGSQGAAAQPKSVAALTPKAPAGQTIPPSPAGGSSTPRPVYPELARKRGQEGTVNVRCQVDASGHVVNVSLAKSSGFKLLDEAALKTVAKWKFKPGKKDGTSVAGTVVVPVQFSLR